jgi:hypoxanthine phosphoribosyltransferase
MARKCSGLFCTAPSVAFMERSQPMKARKFTGGYLQKALKTRQQTAENLARKIRAQKLKFDAIAFTGLSGALIAPLVADKLKKPIIAVRKEKTTHSDCFVEGCFSGKKYIIVDDQISTGATIKSIKDKIKKDPLFRQYKLEAIFLYNDKRPLYYYNDETPVYGH